MKVETGLHPLTRVRLDCKRLLLWLSMADVADVESRPWSSKPKVPMQGLPELGGLSPISLEQI